MRIDHFEGLVLASLTVTYNGRTKIIDRMFIDTGMLIRSLFRMW